MKYRWTNDKPHRVPQADGTVRLYKKGEIVPLSETGAKSFKDKCEPVNDDEPATEPATPPAPSVDGVPEGDRTILINVNANDALAFITGETNVALLNAWHAAEVAHPKYEGGRNKVLEALNERLTALQQ